MRALLTVLLFMGLVAGYSQDTWIQRENMQLARIGATGFAINGMGYVGMGRSAAQQYLKDMWMYNPNFDTWTQKNNYPGGGSYALSVAAVGNEVFMGLGYDGSATQSDWWKYNPVTDSYTQMASYPGLPRYGATAFAIGSKVYLIAGSKGGVPYYQDCYVYDVATNTWTQIADFPAGLRNHTNTFSYGGKGYVSCGTIDLTLSANDMWEYNPVSNTWTQKTSMPGQIRTAASSFQINNLMYICTGLDIQTVFLADLWEYNVLTDTWAARTAFPGPARYFGIGFAVGGFGYVATGGDYTNVYSDIYQYTPVITATEGFFTEEAGVRAFPNPTTGTIRLELMNPEAYETIDVYSSSGTLVKHLDIKNIDLQGFNIANTSGIYLLKIHSACNPPVTLRVAVQ